MLPNPSIVSATGDSSHECGYCGKQSKSVGMWSHSLTTSDYMKLIDFGWRRSGKYLYKPCHDTCCPQYTIRMTSRHFYPQKQLRRAINKLNSSLILSSQKPLIRKNGKVIRSPNTGIDNLKHKIDFSSPFYIPQSCKDSQKHNNNKSIFYLEYELFRYQNIKLVLVPSTFEQDTFELYRKYQRNIHKDALDKLTVNQYTGFLVDHSLVYEPFECTVNLYNIQFNNNGYGFYHLKIFVDDELKAVSFIDILPHCVSSVYSIYQQDGLEWGKLTACYEIYLCRQLSLSLLQLDQYYLGFYIDKCTKMRYKATYKPSSLLCPITFTFVPITTAITKIRKSQLYTQLSTLGNTDIATIDIATIKLIYQGQMYKLQPLLAANEALLDKIIVLLDGLLPPIDIVFTL